MSSEVGASRSWQPERGPDEEHGLALSGGGVRATLFHLGAIWRINELGKLASIDRISAVSGGSFAAGLLARAWPDLRWDGGRALNLGPLFAKPVLRLAKLPLDAPVIALGLVPGINAATVLSRTLDAYFFGGRTLRDLPAKGEGPRFIFNATEISSGSNFRFSRPYAGSYRIGLMPEPSIRLSDAVAASAAFPPLASPLVLRFEPGDFVRTEGADLWARTSLRGKVALLDGGVYDNLGLEPITERCHTYLVSDAGGGLTVSEKSWKWRLWSHQLKRTLDTATAQARYARKRSLLLNLERHPLAYWRTMTDPADFQGIIQPFHVHPGWPRYLAGLPTRISPFPESDRHRLANWGYVSSDLVLRTYIWKDADPPTRLPFPTAPLDAPPAEVPDLAGAHG